MNNGKRSRFLFTMTCFGLAFLYVPMILLVFYSFNKSRIVPVWGGFSTKWYGVLFESEGSLGGNRAKPQGRHGKCHFRNDPRYACRSGTGTFRAL